MVKNKTKNVSLSTMLVTILAILAIVLGGLFVSDAFKPVANNTVKADNTPIVGTGWKYYSEYDDYQNELGTSFNVMYRYYNCSGEDEYDDLEGVLVITNKSIVEDGVEMDENTGYPIVPWSEYCDSIHYIFFDCGTNPRRIGDYVFACLQSLIEVHIPEGVEQISNCAFNGSCTNGGSFVWLPKTLEEDSSFSIDAYGYDGIELVFFDGTESEWVEKSYYIGLQSDEKHYEGNLTLNELAEHYYNNSYSLPEGANVVFLQTETPEPVDPNQGSGSGEQGQGQGGQEQQQEETPATGVELNIGFAVLSLALVGTMFVVAKRKEER